jgi:hypothetical protein
VEIARLRDCWRKKRPPRGSNRKACEFIRPCIVQITRRAVDDLCPRLVLAAARPPVESLNCAFVTHLSVTRQL